MEELQRRIDRVVRAGIQAYIGLLCAGEKERSRRIFSDVLQISSFLAGGPSTRLPISLSAPNAVETGQAALARCMIFYTLRSVLASLLVLRVTAYWSKVPALVDLHQECGRLNRLLGGVTGQQDVAERPDDESHHSGCACSRSTPRDPRDEGGAFAAVELGERPCHGRQDSSRESIGVGR